MRPGHASRLRALFASSPVAGRLTLGKYYSMRLRLLLLGLKAHGASVEAGGIGTGATTGGRPLLEGLEHYREALESGRPVALVGLHAGLVERLHRLPPAKGGKPFFILTAPAFSPPLTAYMARGREQEGKRILWLGGKGDRGLEAGLRAVIAGKGVLAMMADQHPGAKEDCEFLSLWGSVQVPYPARMFRFLAGQGFLFVPVSTRLYPDGSAPVRFHPAFDAAEPERIRGFLEQAIAEAPDQWNWSYPKNRV
jgi:lauroyl/myristoyl acyltransferase